VSVNRAIIIGHLGKPPELRRTSGGEAVCDLSVATSETTKAKDGSRRERTEWHRVVVWGRSAEACAAHLDKGRSVCVEGRLQTRSWDDREGHTRWSTEIVASRVHFLRGPADKRAGTTARESTATPARKGAASAAREGATGAAEAGAGLAVRAGADSDAGRGVDEIDERMGPAADRLAVELELPGMPRDETVGVTPHPVAQRRRARSGSTG
jgi:single-strand DNA-binding protein